MNTNSFSAFNAIIPSAVIALDLSYAIPIGVICIHGRRTLPERRWRLLMALGWVTDIVDLPRLLSGLIADGSRLDSATSR